MAKPMLPMVETFHSLQGKGIQGGRSALFIRLEGCQAGCTGATANTPSWPLEIHPQRSVEDLAAETAADALAGAAFVVITGGEPLERNLTPPPVRSATADRSDPPPGNQWAR
jgi:organic radical activating enzyme